MIHTFLNSHVLMWRGFVFIYSFSQSLWCIPHITISICTTVSSTSTTFSHLCTS